MAHYSGYASVVSCRLLYLVGQLGPGGLERQLHYLLQTLDRGRYQPAVVVWNFSQDDVYVSRIRALNVPLFAFPEISSPAAKLRTFRRLVKQLTPEVVHSYTFYTNFAAHWSVRGTQSLACGSIRCDFGFDVTSSGPLLGRLSARWPRNQICNSSLVAESVRLHKSPFVPRRLVVVCNGLDLEQFRSSPQMNGGKIRVLGVGSLVPRKRWDRLLRAARELKRRKDNFSVQIVGDGPLREALERQAHNLGVADCVEFIRYSDDIPGLLANATFLVHTSDSEGCPNAVMEAMACGRAVVAADAGDIPGLVEDGKTGFVIPRQDETALVARMETLIADRDLCRRMGQAGRVKAERQFGLDRLVSETLSAYRAMGWKDS